MKVRLGHRTGERWVSDGEFLPASFNELWHDYLYINRGDVLLEEADLRNLQEAGFLVAFKRESKPGDFGTGDWKWLAQVVFQEDRFGQTIPVVAIYGSKAGDGRIPRLDNGRITEEIFRELFFS